MLLLPVPSLGDRVQSTERQRQLQCGGQNPVAKVDYAANVGDGTAVEANGGPASYAAAETFSWSSGYTGVSYVVSKVKLAYVSDGASATYLIGEKYLNPASYGSGADAGDNEDCYTGFDNDVSRSTHPNYPPMVDTLGFADTYRFGSPHSGAFNMAFCDGSVRPISYSVNAVVHQLLGNRSDGKAADLAALGPWIFRETSRVGQFGLGHAFDPFDQGGGAHVDRRLLERGQRAVEGVDQNLVQPLR